MMNIDNLPPAVVVVTKPVELFEVFSSEQDCSTNEMFKLVIVISSGIDVTEVLRIGVVHCRLVLGRVRKGRQSVHIVDTKII